MQILCHHRLFELHPLAGSGQGLSRPGITTGQCDNERRQSVIVDLP